MQGLRFVDAAQKQTTAREIGTTEADLLRDDRKKARATATANADPLRGMTTRG
jgi:hypothetical protein